MTTGPATAQASVPPAGMGLGIIASMVRRQFRNGLSGFYVFVVCIALGVMAITAVGALTDSLRKGLERQGREILGGDILLKRVHVRATDEERAVLRKLATTSESANMRATAARTDGTDQTLIALKAIDEKYPMVGSVALASTNAGASNDMLSAVHTRTGAAVEALLLERLNLEIGDKLKIGKAEIEITNVIKSVPDALSGRLSYGPTVLVSLVTLEKTDLVQPGALIRWRYALNLPISKSAEENLIATNAALKRELSGSGFIVTDRRDPAPEIKRILERMRQFLTLVGLTALLVGGVGVASAVATFIDKNRKTIATLKSVGGTGRQIFAIFLSQVIAFALVGVAFGLFLGLLVPGLVGWLFGDTLPITVTTALSVKSVIYAVTYGLLVALIFSVWPLGRLGDVRAAVLFRDEVAATPGWPSRTIIATTAGLITALTAFAILSADARTLAIYFCLSTAVVFAVFIALGTGLSWAARKIPRPAAVDVGLAVRNMGAPGGLTRSVVLSLGTGLSVLVAVALIDASFRYDLESRLPETSPDYYVLDIPGDGLEEFRKVVAQQAPEATVRDAPMLRGRLVKLAGRPVEEIKAPNDAQWVLTGDRGITYADTLPDGSKLVEGTWWSRDYKGPPLVSFESDLGRKLGLKLGDTVTVNILGRDVTAKIANFREVDWDSLAINFVMVFTSDTLKGAPSNRLATIKFPAGTSLRKEADIGRRLTSMFPTTTQIRVKDAIASFNEIFKKVMAAVRAAGALTLIVGAVVLAGALSTARRRRARDAVILRTLGATRSRILKIHLIEYLLVAVATAGFAILLGTAAAALVLTQVMDMPVAFSTFAIAQVVALALGLVVVFGTLGTAMALNARPVQFLRTE